MKRILLIIFIVLLFGGMFEVFPQSVKENLKLRSPNGRIEVSFSLDQTNAPAYSVNYDGQTIINPSTLGLILKEGNSLSQGMIVAGAKRDAHDETYELVVGKAKQARDHYNELAIALQEQNGLKRKWQIVFRTFDDGVAFRYLIPEQDGLKTFEIVDEKSEFRFPSDFACWALQLRTFHSNYEKEFDKISLDQIKPGARVGLPLTIQTPQGTTLAIMEANLKDYAGMYLQGVEGASNALVSRLSPLTTDESIAVLRLRTRRPGAS